MFMVHRSLLSRYERHRTHRSPYETERKEIICICSGFVFSLSPSPSLVCFVEHNLLQNICNIQKQSKRIMLFSYEKCTEKEAIWLKRTAANIREVL